MVGVYAKNLNTNVGTLTTEKFLFYFLKVDILILQPHYLIPLHIKQIFKIMTCDKSLQKHTASLSNLLL